MSLAWRSPLAPPLWGMDAGNMVVFYDEMSINTGWQFPIMAIFATTLVPSCEFSVAAQDTVDFRYSPPEWQTAICLPDDPQKSLVEKSGELLYHYNKARSEEHTSELQS